MRQEQFFIDEKFVLYLSIEREDRAMNQSLKLVRFLSISVHKH